MTAYRRLFNLFLSGLLILTTLSGCSSLNLSTLTDNLNRQTDLDLVCEGAPAYLLMLDSLVADHPDNPKLLLGGVQAYTAYAGAVGECGHPERVSAMTAKSRAYGLALLREETGITPEMTFPELEAALPKVGKDEVGPLFWGGYGWALWIASQDGSPTALVDLLRVEQLMQRVVAMDDTYFRGGAHLFLGINYGSRPVLYGGNPELAKQHFERALAINKRTFLPVQVAYAQYYAKTQFDRELYLKLLEEVLDFDPAKAPELTLSNLVAQRQARRLLAKIDDYF
jgi:hypothetical protein